MDFEMTNVTVTVNVNLDRGDKKRLFELIEDLLDHHEDHHEDSCEPPNRDFGAVLDCEVPN